MQNETQNPREQQKNSAAQINEDPTRFPQRDRDNENLGDTRVDPQYSNPERNNKNEDSDNRGNLK